MAWIPRRIVRILTVVVILGVLAVAVASISVVPALSGKITALDGRAVSEAYIAYRYKGSRFNFVDTLNYYRPGEVLLTGATATFYVPGFLQPHFPLDGPLVPWIEWVYVPDLHHFFGPIAPATETIPGLIENDRSNHVVRLANLVDDPERWSGTIRDLERVIYASQAEPVNPDAVIHITEAQRQALRQHCDREFVEFMQRHANTPRTIPDMPDLPNLPEEERRERIERVRKDFERYPLWGPYMEDRWPELAN